MNRNIKPITQSNVVVIFNLRPNIVDIQLNTLIPVGIAIIMVAEVK